MGQVDDGTVSLWMPLVNALGWAAGGVNSRRRSQSQRMSGSGQSESAFRTWRSAMRSPSGFGSGTRTGLATSWSGQTRRCVGAARPVSAQKIPGSSVRLGVIADSDLWEDKGLPPVIW